MTGGLTAGPAAPCQSTENVSITPLGAGSPRMVTTNWWPSGAKPIAAATPVGFVGSGGFVGLNGVESDSVDPGIGVRWPPDENDQPVMFALTSLTTYSRLPWLVRLIGRVPPELTLSTSTGPADVVLNELMVLFPALTTNNSLPSGVMLVDPEESTIGKPNGGSDAAPLPPVGTGAPVWVRVPSAWRVYAITALPDGLLVVVYSASGAA